MTEQGKKDYRGTVLTPQTDFPMRGSLPQREPERLAKWQAEGLYEKIQRNRADRPSYVLHDGPPYANGDIHLGHALNKILKDVIVKYKAMSGFRAPYVPGWDCHGLPIEQQVGKKLGGKLKSMTPAEVRKLCHEYAAKFVDIQREQFKRLGVFGDWDRPYETFAPKYEAGILATLRDLVANGLVRKGLKPVHWDPVFQTALAEAEIEYKQHTSDSIYVKFPLRDPSAAPSLAGLDRVSVVIWTTTPWTLPANLAVCLHPEFEYVVLAAPDGEHLIVAKGLADAFRKACNLTEATEVRSFRAAEIENALCRHPVFSEKSSVVLLGRHVTLEMGTGCVHTAPGHGMDDYLIALQYGLPIFVPVDDRGCYTADYPDMQGVSVFDANPKVVEMLRERNLLLGHSKYVHEYPHSWRSHKPVIFRATEQWFMELAEGSVRERALKAIDEEVRWIPKWGHDRIRAMVEQRPDWCLSRQRSWGVPIPAIRPKRGGSSILDVRLMDSLIALVAERGTDVWFTEPVAAFWPAEGLSPETVARHDLAGLGPDDFDKEWDILDVWFDSGASHVAFLESDPRVSSPADLYLEGSDQHRGWFQSALLTSIGARGRAPYRGVLTHGFLLDGNGKPMSKSEGNVIPPLEVIDKLGADILRLWVCSEDYRLDLRVSNEILDRTADAYRRIRNTMRFLLGNLHDFDPATDAIPPERMPEIDRWALSKLTEFVGKAREAYEEFQFHRVNHLAHAFCNTHLSAVYLDVLKDRLYCSAPADETRRAAQTVLHRTVRDLARVLAPILSFTADEVWESGRFAAEGVHLQDFPEARGEWRDSALEEKWDRLIALRDEASLALEEKRREKTIGHSLDAEIEIVASDDAERAFLEENLSTLQTLFIVSGASVAPPSEGAGGEGRIRVRKCSRPKCERCWIRYPSVGAHPDHPGLCDRCADVVRKVEVG